MAWRFFLQGGQTDYDKRVSSSATAGMLILMNDAIITNIDLHMNAFIEYDI